MPDPSAKLPPEAYEFIWKLAIFQIAEGQPQRSTAILEMCADERAPASIKTPAARVLELLIASNEPNQTPQSATAAAIDLAIGIGEDLVQSGQLELAESVFWRLANRKVACQPDRVAFLLGTTLLLQEKIEEAREAFESALATYPGSSLAPLAAIRLAIIHTGWLEEPQSGRKFLERAINDYPDSPHRARALFFLATLELWNDQPHQSLELFRQLLAEYPSANEIPYALVNIENLKSQLQIP